MLRSTRVQRFTLPVKSMLGWAGLHWTARQNGRDRSTDKYDVLFRF
jgi:hypothetical protein